MKTKVFGKLLLMSIFSISLASGRENREYNNSVNQERITKSDKKTNAQKELDDLARSLGVIIKPPAGWQEPFAFIGEGKPFLSQLVMKEKRFSPAHYLVWLDDNHNITQGEIEVVIFAAGGFPIGIIVISPEKWIRPDGELCVYEFDDNREAIAAPIQFKHERGFKVRATFERPNFLNNKKMDKMMEDALYFSSDKAFVAIRLRSLRDKFEDMNKRVFRPFLDSIILRTGRTMHP